MAIAIATGLIVLLGYFIDIPTLAYLNSTILNWVIILAALALFIGLYNLLTVHISKIRTKEKGGLYSIILIVSMLITLILGLWLKPNHAVLGVLFNAVMAPVEKSLMAIMVITLTYASFRLLRRSNNILSLIFIITALLILLGTAPIPFIGYIPVIGDIIRPFIAQVLAAAGARGILIGIALGALTTGLRVLFGADQPYGSDPSGGEK